MISQYDNTLSWYENVGNGLSATYFSSVQHNINSAAGAPVGMLLADLDLDGDDDSEWSILHFTFAVWGSASRDVVIRVLCVFRRVACCASPVVYAGRDDVFAWHPQLLRTQHVTPTGSDIACATTTPTGGPSTAR